MGYEPRFIRPTAPAADRAIVVGDPGRALTLAQDLIAKPPPMFNHHRGLWGYSGAAIRDGAPLTVQGTGLGATSTNAVVTDLIGLGVERLVRVGSCSSTGWLRAGELVVVSQAVGLDGVSLTLHPGANVFLTDSILATRLKAELAGAATVGAVESVDLGHPGSPAAPATANPQAALETLATDLATASLLATAARRGAAAAAVLVVVRDDERELTDAETEAAARTAGAAAAAALS